MQGLPVLATVSAAYRFVFREIGTILRLSWLPLLLVTLIQNATAALIIGQQNDASAAFASPSVWAGWGIRALVFALGTSIVAVALHRVILFNQRRGGEFFYLRIGRQELLFMLPPLIVSAALAVLILLLNLPVWIFAVLFPAALALIYAVTRFSLIFPVTLVKGHYDLDEVRRITSGKFWQLFAIGLLTLLPFGMIYSLLQRLIAFGTFSLDPEAIAHTVIDTPTLLAMTVLQWLAKIIVAALGVGALSYSYKALTGRAADEVLTP